MNKIELLENLIESAKKASYENQEEFRDLEKRTEMIVRKLFGAKSHYLDDLHNINYAAFGVLDENTNHRIFFEGGLREYRNLLNVMLEDLTLSSNYNEVQINIKPKRGKQLSPKTKLQREIRVFIASPSDVTIERDLLLHKLETKFRREKHEERCKCRIIVEGWETLPSQIGYAQDIVNEDLLSKTDIVLAVFRHKLGTPTTHPNNSEQRAPSGTAEELLYAIRNKGVKNSPLGMAYFYSTAPVISLDLHNFKEVAGEWKKLKKFKQEIKNEIMYKPYNIEEEILEIVCKDLCDNIIKYFNHD